MKQVCVAILVGLMVGTLGRSVRDDNDYRHGFRDDDESNKKLIAGAWIDQNPDNALTYEDVRQCISVSLRQAATLSKGQIHAEDWQPSAVLKFRTQVVQGVNVFMSVVLDNEGGEQKLFEFKTWIQAWKDDVNDIYTLDDYNFTDYNPSSLKRKLSPASITKFVELLPLKDTKEVHVIAVFADSKTGLWVGQYTYQNKTHESWIIQNKSKNTHRVFYHGVVPQTFRKRVESSGKWSERSFAHTLKGHRRNPLKKH